MKFSAKEIVDIAIGIEESGYRFYSECAKKFSDARLNELFSLFAEEELKHRELFEDMLKGLDDVEGSFTDEYYQYLTAFGDEKVFKDKKRIDAFLKKIEKPVDAIKHALIAEKDSILYYTELKELYYNDNQTLILLNRIISEERRHVNSLMNLREIIGEKPI